MKWLKAHKIQLDPTRTQTSYFAKACGTARFARNWALAEWKKQYGEGKKPNEAALRRQFNSLKATEWPWTSEVTKSAAQQGIRNLGMVFARFFDGKAGYR